MRELKPRAFTLVELLVVILILAIVAAIAIPMTANASLRSKQAAETQELKLLNDASEYFHSDTGKYPATLNDLAVTTAPANGLDAQGNTLPISANTWHGPYLTQIDSDPVPNDQFTYNTASPLVGKVTVTVTSSSTSNTSSTGTTGTTGTSTTSTSTTGTSTTGTTTTSTSTTGLTSTGGQHGGGG